MKKIYSFINFKYKYFLVLFLFLIQDILAKNEIFLIVNKTKGNKIIYSSYYSFISEVIVNGLIGTIYNYTYLLNEEINNISIKFNSYLNTTENMFKLMNNIIYIDLSNFISSYVKSMSLMFYCESLSSINLNNFDTSLVTDMNGVFFGCISLKSLDLSNFNTSLVTNMLSLFCGCTSLISLDLSNFNTSSVINMNGVFNTCTSLKSVNIKNFDTSSVKNIGYMFAWCNSLESLDLSNFNTSSAIYMDFMFCECKSLKRLTLNSFNTSLVKDMRYMFEGCNSLQSLYIDNFNLSLVKDTSFMFSGCSSLISLNLTNFEVNTTIDYFNMFSQCNKKLKYCLNTKKTYVFINLLKEYEYNCRDICIDYHSKKFIKDENLCIENCSSNEKYKYEYDNTCYNQCPSYTKLIEGSNYLCNLSEIIPTDQNNEEENNNIKLIIIIIITVLILIIIIIIFIIVNKAQTGKKVKIIFIKGDDQTKHQIKIDSEKTVENSIEMFYKHIGEKNNDKKMFLLNGENIATKDNENTKIEQYIQRNYTNSTLNVLVYDVDG